MSIGKLRQGKFACLAAAIAIGAAVFTAPALARGGPGGWHGGAMHGAVFHGAAWHGAAWHGAAWRGAAWRGAAWHGGWHGRFFPHHRFAFFHRRHFGPFFGIYAGGYSSCWSWVPTPLGWRYVWACGPYGYGYY